jgi:hypothetical protein
LRHYSRCPVPGLYNLPRASRGQVKKLAALARALALHAPTKEAPAHDKANPFIAALLAAGAPDQEDIAYLWPCNVDAWNVWCDVQTQWLYAGMGSATGLNYAGVCAHLDELGLCGDERREVYAGVRAAERATLEARAERESAANP